MTSHTSNTASTDFEPELAFAFEVVAEVTPPLHIGHAGTAELSFTPITGGTVEGPRLNGKVLSGGGDWATLRTNHVFALDARYLIEADDGSVIDIVNAGFWSASREVEAKLEAGEAVEPSEYYFRTQPTFRTDADAHEWMTRTVFVGVAYDELRLGRVRIKFYEVR